MRDKEKYSEEKYRRLNIFGDAIHKDFSSSNFANFTSFISTSNALRRGIENTESPSI
jgi:hypothetical protein